MAQQDTPDELLAQLEELIDSFSSRFNGALGQFRQGVEAMFRFANMEDIDATCKLLEERGAPLYLDDIVKELKRGGLFRAQSSTSRGGPDADMKRSISRFAGRNDGKGDRIRFFAEDLVGLADWIDGQYPGPKKVQTSGT